MSKDASSKSKVLLGRHKNKIDAIVTFLETHIAPLPEVLSIRLGKLARCRPGKKGSATSRKLGNGAISFHLTRWATAGRKITGIVASVSNGQLVQQVIILSNEPEHLKRRLQKAGYGGGDW